MQHIKNTGERFANSSVSKYFAIHSGIGYIQRSTAHKGGRDGRRVQSNSGGSQRWAKWHLAHAGLARGTANTDSSVKSKKNGRNMIDLEKIVASGFERIRQSDEGEPAFTKTVPVKFLSEIVRSLFHGTDVSDSDVASVWIEPADGVGISV